MTRVRRSDRLFWPELNFAGIGNSEWSTLEYEIHLRYHDKSTIHTLLRPRSPQTPILLLVVSA